MRSTLIQIRPPLAGINNDFARISQPPNTTVDCRDVFPYGTDFRSRIASRPGVAAASITTVGSGQITLFQQMSYVSGGVVASRMFAVAGSIGAGAGKGKMYTIAGGVIKETTSAASTATITTTAGTAPLTYAGAVVHRNRLICYGPDHQWAASKVDDYGNWDYADRTAARAFRHTDIISSSPGSAADPIVTAIPWTNDLLVFAGDHSLWAVRGDLAMGGRVDLLSAGIGILGPSAWTIDPQGQLWIIGSGGIYKGNGAGFTPVNVAHYSAYFQSLNRNTHYPSCAWDRDRYGLWIFAKGKDALFFNARDNSFWPCNLSTTAVAAGIFDGPAPADRQILFAESGGGAKTIDSAATTDTAGGLISAYIYLGPFIPFGMNQNAVLKETTITLGERSANVTYTLQAGNSPYQAYNSPTQTSTGALAAATSRQSKIRSRLRGSCFYLKLACTGGANDLFEFEEGLLSFTPAGRVHS